jgi:hypothetical protein
MTQQTKDKIKAGSTTFSECGFLFFIAGYLVIVGLYSALYVLAIFGGALLIPTIWLAVATYKLELRRIALYRELDELTKTVSEYLAEVPTTPK